MAQMKIYNTPMIVEGVTFAGKFCKIQCVAGLKGKKFSPRALKEAVIHLKKCIDQFVVREPFFLK